jgi:hemoglobin
MNPSSGKLWEALGGERVLARVVDRFVDLAVTDPRVNYTRDGRYPSDEEALKFTKRAALAFISAATGGPHSYAGKSIREIHAGMRISNSEFDAMLADFQQALEENGVSSALRQVAIGMVNATRADIVAIP